MGHHGWSCCAPVSAVVHHVPEEHGGSRQRCSSTSCFADLMNHSKTLCAATTSPRTLDSTRLHCMDCVRVCVCVCDQCHAHGTGQ